MPKTIVEKALPWKIQAGAVSWCPTMDLVMFAPSAGEQIALYRLSGQRVWSSNNRKRAKAVSSTWKNDGKSLAVIYDDDSYQIFSTTTGKIIYTSEARKIAHVEWLRGLVFDNDVQDGSVNKIIEVDVLRHLPRLPLLPSGHQLFTKITNTDLSNCPIEFLAEGSLDGSFSLDLYGFFPIGGPNQYPDGGKIMAIAALEDLSQHFTLVQTAQGKLELAIYHTRLVQKLGVTYLPEVSLVPSMIQTTCDYVHDALRSLTKELKLIHEISAKVVGQYGSEDDIINDMFDTLITGVYSPELNEWMDNINESGFKKYASTVYNCYDNSRKVLFENVLPGCERITVLLSRLRGLARWKARGSPMGLDPEKIRASLDQILRITEQCYKALWAITAELELFKSFISWLEHCFNTFLERTMNKTGIENIVKSEVQTNDVSKYITTYFNRPSVSTNDINDLLVGVGGLSASCQQAFKDIKAALRNEIVPQIPITISESILRAGIRNVDRHTIYIYLQEDKSTPVLQLFKITLNENAQPILRSVSININGEPFTQAEFVDDDEIMIIQEDNLYQFNYRKLDDKETMLEVRQAPQFTQTSLNGFKPCFIALNGHKDHRIGCLIGEDMQRYRFFGLDEEE